MMPDAAKIRAWKISEMRHAVGRPHMKNFNPRFLPLLAVVLLCHCGAPQLPQCAHVPSSSRVPAPTLLTEARSSWKILANPARKRDWPAATESYNAALAKLFDQLRCGPGDWPTRAATLGTAIAPPAAQNIDPATLDGLFPASVVNTKILTQRMITAGVGLPLVGWKKTTPVGHSRAPFTLPTGLPYLATATLDFSRAGQPVWHLNKRWYQEETQVGNTSHPLAADWSAPNACFWAMSELDNLALQNVILPDRLSEETGFYFLEPYDPEKIPLVLVHGLVSSPAAFKETINSLIPDPWFRQHYQIWLYNYPTGNPWTYSASRFREKMHEVCAYARSKGDSRNLDRMVVVGHSMGGVITHASIVNPGTAFYDAQFSKPLDQLHVSADGRKVIRDTLLYQPLQEPKRVVFMATPHRGSPMADFRFAVWISRLIRLPKTLTVELLDNTLNAVGDIAQGEPPDSLFATSIGTLSPANKATRILNTLPLPANVTIHSIIGDRGKGNSPNSSDGVVPYWSSHVSPVASETVVPSGHGVQDNAAANAELKRILLLHVGADASRQDVRSKIRANNAPVVNVSHQ